MFPKILAGVIFVSAVSACGSRPRVETPAAAVAAATEPEAASAATVATLSAAQLQTIERGVKTMITNPESAKFTRVKGMTVTGKPGVQVCGHVTYKGEDGKAGQPQPYYLELGEKAGAPVAERGQVGSTPPALSKVNFMCRRHNPG